MGKERITNLNVKAGIGAIIDVRGYIRSYHMRRYKWLAAKIAEKPSEANILIEEFKQYMKKMRGYNVKIKLKKNKLPLKKFGVRSNESIDTFLVDICIHRGLRYMYYKFKKKL